jgi:hypothetical protein
VTVANERNGHSFDPGTRAILGELRDLRLDAAEDRRRADEDRERYAEERRQADARFEALIREFRQDSARREAATQKMFQDIRRDIRTVGLSIVKTLNRHTKILERIDRKLTPGSNGRAGA